MNILGINGWHERSHDAAACILQDGQLKFALEEERVSRRKHSFDALPTQAIFYALRSTKLSIDDIGVIAVGWQLDKLLGQGIAKEQILETIFPQSKFHYTKIPKLIFVSHHLAHAYYSYYSSPFSTQL